MVLLCGAGVAQEATAAAGVESAYAPNQTSSQSDIAVLPDLDALPTGPIALSSSGTEEDLQVAPPKDAATVHATATPDSSKVEQTKRILGIIPNFRAISSDEKLPPQSVKTKFTTAAEDSFDYSSIFIPLALAGYSQMTNSTPEFGTGATAYGRYLWHAAVDQTQENFMVEFIVPSLTHEDTRYYTLGRGGFLKRSGYALSRAVITRSDAGNDTFNMSEVVGAGASAGISSLYYPSRERTFGNTGKEWALDIGIDALSFEAKEFWPNINQWLFHRKSPAARGSQ
jgi:hypothetical protein